MPKFLCAGYGYVAKAFCAQLPAGDWTGTSRDPSKGQNAIVRFDEDTPLSRSLLHAHSHLLVSIPPCARGDLLIDLHLRDLLDHPNLKWIGYLSSTAVYGNTYGQWVDETSTICPTDDVAEARARSESMWISLFEQHRLPVHIFRLAGIYGPGRSVVDAVRLGKAKRIHKPGQYFSRIHVDDIVQTLMKSIATPHPGAIYNLADDEPCSTEVLVEYVCDALELPYPPRISFDQADLSEMARRFYNDNRRVRNDKIKEELGVQLRYPTFREGLSAILDL